jgi:hypothetical protein
MAFRSAGSFVAVSLGLVSFLLCVATRAPAEVTRWEIKQREPYQAGRALGERGPYEKLTGTIHYAIDPANEANQPIVDLKLAPVNEQKRVEFSADFELLVPVDRTKANGAVFYEVNNRGNRTAPNLIDGGADDFLCRQGFVVLTSGWIAENHPGNQRRLLRAPVATAGGKPIRGPVRQEFVLDKAATRTSVGHRGNLGSYRPAADAMPSAVLSARERESDPRRVIPRADWDFQVTEVTVEGTAGQLPLVEIDYQAGFQPGLIYEVVYEAEGAIVQGVGLAAIRDTISSLKYARDPAQNPLLDETKQPLVTRALGFGTSQSGRLLRHFLWEGFNADEQGRMAFDGVISHVAGGGLGSFNHRFASPTRTNGQHDEHLFPADFFPFTYGESTDPHTGQVDGILRKAIATKTAPKVFHTQSSSEYWHRSGSLVHTDPLAKADASIPDLVRIYSFGGTQHGSGGGVPGAKGNGTLPASPADYRPLMRALVVALDAWVQQGIEPPPSVFPKLADGTLVNWPRGESGWPNLPGVDYPQVIQRPSLLDRGPRWDQERIATIEPPLVKAHYEVRVPVMAADGNERGTLNLPAITVPVGTYTSWNLRGEAVGAAGELLSLQGGFIPFAKTKAARAESKDPRPSLAELYRDYDDYEARYLAAAEKLVSQRYLLAEDLPRLKALCQKFQPLFADRAPSK